MKDKSEFIRQIQYRNKQLVIGICRWIKKQPNNVTNQVIFRQLIKSCTSVAANYRSACVARSSREFYSKMSIVVEEADETYFWLDLVKSLNSKSEFELEKLMQECKEILLITSKARSQKYKR